MFAVAAKSAVQKFECPLVDANAGNWPKFHGFAYDFFVFVDDSVLDAFKAGESAIGIECVPENAFEHVTSAYACF